MARDYLTSVHGRKLGIGKSGEILADFAGKGGVPAELVVAASTAASTAVTATDAETIFSTGQYTIPAHTLVPGSVIKVRWQGIATATNSTDTLAINVRFGGIAGTVLFTHAATDVANSNVFTGEYEVIIRTIGATGTMVGVGVGKSVPAAEGTMTSKDDILASTAVDTTEDIDIVVTATWSTTNAGNSCRLDIFRVSIA